MEITSDYSIFPGLSYPDNEAVGQQEQSTEDPATIHRHEAQMNQWRGQHRGLTFSVAICNVTRVCVLTSDHCFEFYGDSLSPSSCVSRGSL